MSRRRIKRVPFPSSRLVYKPDAYCVMVADNGYLHGEATWRRKDSIWSCIAADQCLMFLRPLDPAAAKFALVQRGFNWDWRDAEKCNGLQSGTRGVPIVAAQVPQSQDELMPGDAPPKKLIGQAGAVSGPKTALTSSMSCHESQPDRLIPIGWATRPTPSIAPASSS